MKKILTQLKKRLLPGKKKAKQNPMPTALVPATIAEANRVMPEKLVQCKAYFDEIAQKLHNKEPFTAHDYHRAQLAIIALGSKFYTEYNREMGHLLGLTAPRVPHSGAKAPGQE